MSGFFLVDKKSSVEILIPEAVVRRCSVKKVFLEVLQNSLENTCARVSRPATLLENRLWHRSFPVNFEKFLRTPTFYRTPPVALSAIHIQHKFTYNIHT